MIRPVTLNVKQILEKNDVVVNTLRESWGVVDSYQIGFACSCLISKRGAQRK